MPYKSYKILVSKLFHPSPHPNPIGHHQSLPQDPHGLLLLQLQLHQQALRYKSLRARFSSSFSLQRAIARMQPRIERLGSLWGESKLRAQRKLQELVRSESSRTGMRQPHALDLQPHATSSLPMPTSPQDNAQQHHNAEASTSISVVHKEDAMFGQDGLLRHVLLKSVASLSSAFMQRWNTTEVTGRENIEAALKRPQNQGLVTVCNHVAAMDDPLVMASLVPSHYFDQPSSLRWTLCATDRCFKYAGLSEIFTAMKVLPVQRGAGMRQPGLAAAESRVAAGDWVHLFPEGTRSRNPSRMGPIRKGVGRLVAAAAQQAAQHGGRPPLVVPFVHAGMEDVMPVGRLLPCTGQMVKVVVGKPIAMDDLLQAAEVHAWSEDALYTAIANRIQTRMHALHASLHAQEVELVTDQQAETEASSVLPSATPPWALPDLNFPRDQALGSPLFANPIQGLLGASLAQPSGLQNGRAALQAGLSSPECEGSHWLSPQAQSSSSSSSNAEQQGVLQSSSNFSGLLQGSGVVGEESTSTEGSSGSSRSSSSSSSCDAVQQGVLQGSGNPSELLQDRGSGVAGDGATCAENSREYAWRSIQRSRLGMALKWMEDMHQGGKEQRSGSIRGSKGSDSGLCERLFYGFSLPLRPVSALVL